MSSKIKLIIGAAGFILLIGAAAIAYNALGRQAEPVQRETEAAGGQNQKAPDFNMIDKDGNNITLSGIIARGKPVVLNFWASWCPPCKIEMPEFDKVYREMGDVVEFVMVDLADGQRETVKKGTQYVHEQGFAFPVYFDTQQEGGYVYGIRSIPTTLFIDKNGYIITAAQGAINEPTLRKGIGFIK